MPTIRIYLLLLAFFAGTQFSIAQNALDFDGIGDRGVATNASALITNGNLSMAMWVYPTNPAAGWPDFDGMGGFRNESNCDFYLLQLNSTTLEARIRTNNGNATTIAYSGLQLNAWNHFVLTYDGSMLRLYHNGMPADSTGASGTITLGNVPFYIGTVPFQTTDFDLDGRLDDVCLWNRALSASDVSAWYNACEPDVNDPGLQLCYKFNQGVAGGNNSGITSAIDSKGNINATLSGLGLTGTTSNFIAYGNPSLTVVVDSASCNYTSPSGNDIWDSTGVYNDTLTNAAGCDSIVQVDLTIIPLGSTITVDECDFYDSPSGNFTWTTSGVYNDTLIAAGGCDSVITINLTIEQTSSAVISDTVCGSYTSPSGLIWTTSGTYADTISNMAGCDSTLTINLMVNSADTSVTQNGATLTANATNSTYQWVNCDNNFTAIPGQTNATFVAASDGNYAVVVTQNGCTDTSACFNVVLISAPEPNALAGVKVYPNPHTGHFALELPSVYHSISGRILDATGREVMQFATEDSDRVELNLEAPAGVYFAEVYADGMRKVVKMVLR